MARVHITEITIRALKSPPSGQVMYWDDGLPGFGVRVSQGGTKTFTLVHGDKRKRTTIGRYPIITLAEARGQAKRMLAQRTLTRLDAPTISFADALIQFFSTHCDQLNRPSTAKCTKQLLNTYFLPKLDRVDLGEISRHQMAALIDELPTPGVANHAFAAVRTFFKWSVRRGYIPHSPCEGMQLPARPVTRERVLTDPELAAVWNAAGAVDIAGGTIVRLLILTGQRRSEIGALHSEFIDRKAKTITLPAALCKNNRTHTFPYGETAAKILSDLPAEGFLFPARGTDGERPFSGWSKTKIALDRAIAGDDEEKAISPWTLHDLRRTFATNLAALGTPPHIVERLLNHASGTISGVAAIYNKFEYAVEMRTAINAWEDRLAALLREYQSGKLSPLRVHSRGSAPSLRRIPAA